MSSYVFENGTIIIATFPVLGSFVVQYCKRGQPSNSEREETHEFELGGGWHIQTDDVMRDGEMLRSHTDQGRHNLLNHDIHHFVGAAPRRLFNDFAKLRYRHSFAQGIVILYSQGAWSYRLTEIICESVLFL